MAFLKGDVRRLFGTAGTRRPTGRGPIVYGRASCPQGAETCFELADYGFCPINQDYKLMQGNLLGFGCVIVRRGEDAAPYLLNPKEGAGGFH
jgi:hypothetical protein